MRFHASLLMLAFSAALPAHAHTSPNASEVTWEALPCAPTLCETYWISGEHLGGCETPWPPESVYKGYDDVTTTPAPAAPDGMITVLQATIDPAIDWDLFICTTQGAELARGANIFGEPCDGATGPNTTVPVGCHEDASTPRSAGQISILRAYNYLDIPTATGRYWFTFVDRP